MDYQLGWDAKISRTCRTNQALGSTFYLSKKKYFNGKDFSEYK
jgi:hypothetical protein